MIVKPSTEMARRPVERATEDDSEPEPRDRGHV